MEEGLAIETVTIKSEPLDDTDSDNETLIHYATRVKAEPVELGCPIKLEPTTIKVEIEECTPELLELRASDLEGPECDLEGPECDICGGRYRNKQGLSAHKKRVHFNAALAKSKKDGKCVYCLKKYVNRKSLYTHMNKMHLLNNGVGYQFRCEDCGKVFRIRNSLWMHRYHHHSGLDLRRACQHCSRVLKTPRSLRDHILKKHPMQFVSKEHDGPLDEDEAILLSRPHVCPLCERRYTSNSILKKHMQTVHPTPDESRRCAVCLRHFKTERRLASHLETAHSDADALRKCDICGQVYKNKYSLQHHVKHAHGERKPLSSGRLCTAEEAQGYKRRPHAVPVAPELADSLVRHAPDQLNITDFIVPDII